MAANGAGEVFIIRPDKHLTKEAHTKLNNYKTLLSLDGGGLRGLITAKVLIRLEKIIKKVIQKDRSKLLEPQYQDVAVDDTKFDIDIADWFDMLAGTSTGGLLAIYLAGKGGNRTLPPYVDEDGKPTRIGSATGAASLYRTEGKRIFGTSGTDKVKNFLASGGKNQHSADGLIGVVNDNFKNMTMLDIPTNLVVASVDVTNARTALFFRKASDTRVWSKDADSAAGGAGFAVPRRLVDDGEVLMRPAPSTRDTYEHSRRRPVGHLRLGQLKLVAAAELDSEQSRDRASGAWFPAIVYKEADFRIEDVARATTAAPGFLPPTFFGSVDGKAVGTTQFVDGGLGNNDPTWVALAMMLKNDERPEAFGGDAGADIDKQYQGIANTAILSIGTGQMRYCEAYLSPSDPRYAQLKEAIDAANSEKAAEASAASGGERRTWAGWLASAAGAAGQRLAGGWLTDTWLLKTAASIVGLLGALTSLAMAVTGEDKGNILNMLYYGLLRLPEGQYMRVQLKHDFKALVDGPVDLAGEAPSGTAGRTAQQARLLAALGHMDDPRWMAEYDIMGDWLADRYEARMEWWVRHFLFGMGDPYKSRMPKRILSGTGSGSLPS